MTAGWLRARLAVGEWRPSTVEQAAADYLLAHLDWSVKDDSLAAKQILATQTVAALRDFMQQRGPSLYRSGPASLYSILGALIVRLSLLRLPPGNEPPIGYADHDLRGRLIDAEVSISELQELLRENHRLPIEGLSDHA